MFIYFCYSKPKSYTSVQTLTKKKKKKKSKKMYVKKRTYGNLQILHN